MSEAPIDPEKRKALKGLIGEITVRLRQIDMEKEAIKDIVEAGEDTFGIAKKYLNKLARTVYKQNYEDIRQEASHFEDLYEAIAEGRVQE